MDLTHAAVIREEKISVEKKNAYITLAVGRLGVIFLINDWLGSVQPSEGGTIPKQVNLERLKKEGIGEPGRASQ